MGIDFKAIKETIRADQVINLLGLKGKYEQSAQFRCACPQCKPEGKRELSINTELKVFQCYAARTRTAGDIIYLVAHVRGIGQREAAQLLHDNFMREEAKPKRKIVDRRRKTINQNAKPAAHADDYNIVTHMQHWSK